MKTVIYNLEKKKNGANVHTVSKAIHYLRILSEESWMFPDEEERKKTYENHLERCRVAANTNKFDALRTSMMRWL